MILPTILRPGGRGQSLAEFALILPVLLLIVLAVFDMGRAVYAYSTIDNAARTAARVAIVDQTFATIQDRAAQQAVSLGISASAVIVSFRTADDSAGCPARSLGCLAVVTVPYDFTAITPVIGNIVGPISMSSTSKIPIERHFP